MNIDDDDGVGGEGRGVMAGRQMIFVYERDQRQNICCFVLNVLNVTMVSIDLVFNFTLGISTILIIMAPLWIIVFPSQLLQA